jgi:hypothetical protein
MQISNMAFVDTVDINTHLPTDKISTDNVPDDVEDIIQDVERVLRGYLAGTFPSATIALWATPGATPGTIRAIGGRLGAAFIYRLRYAENALDDPEYAQIKYNEAMKMLAGVISGDLILEEVGQIETGQSLTTDMFYPNSPGTQPPKFTMDSIF